jgi:tetratricopeptide (TPR) repeat protein
MRKIAAAILLAVTALAAAGGEEKAAAPEGLLHLALPGRTWALDIALGGFAMEESQMARDGGSLSIMANNKATGVRISVFLEKAAKEGDSKACRNYYWQGAEDGTGKDGRTIKFSERGETAIVESQLGSGDSVWKNTNAYLSRDGIWIDIHMSKFGYKAEDAKSFDAVLDTVKINDAFTPTVEDYTRWGESFLATGSFLAAGENYGKAVELEKKDPKLSKPQWRALVNEWGIAYGMMGDFENAKKAFEYGISVDAGYPLFYYNLACTYGEMGDVDNAAANLRKAFENKANLSADEKMPEPKADASFRRIAGEAKFKEALAAIEGTAAGK